MVIGCLESEVVTADNYRRAAAEISAFFGRDDMRSYMLRNRPGMFGRLGPSGEGNWEPRSIAEDRLAGDLEGPRRHTIFRRLGTMVMYGFSVDGITVRHYTSGREYSGRLIDYVSSDATEHEHTEAVCELAFGDGYMGGVLATLTPGELERSSGIPQVLEAAGSVSVLSVVEAPLAMGLVNANRKPMQLYYLAPAADTPPVRAVQRATVRVLHQSDDAPQNG